MDARNMGTTGAGAVISGDQATIWNVGDSRVYLFRNGDLTQLSRDHSVVQLLIDRGIIPEEESYRSIDAGELLQYLGMVPEDGTEPRAFIATEKLVPGDILLLCSDGLSGELGEEVLRDILEDSKDRTAEYIVTNLVKRAVDGRCRDNASVIVCKIT
ncbi:MAG: serine/threonine-protein phosphatase, partial [Lachnospiraceae bacterium]|nr:serine/threonine-protein phosphatase [Lachnospiraceae bacterium]